MQSTRREYFTSSCILETLALMGNNNAEGFSNCCLVETQSASAAFFRASTRAEQHVLTRSGGNQHFCSAWMWIISFIWSLNDGCIRRWRLRSLLLSCPVTLRWNALNLPAAQNRVFNKTITWNMNRELHNNVPVPHANRDFHQQPFSLSSACLRPLVRER